MNNLRHTWQWRAELLCVCACLALGATGFAGERIVVPGAKSKFEPGAEKKLTPEATKDLGRMMAPDPFRTLTPDMPILPPLDPKEQRRLRNARAERENWMILDPGELQQEEEERNLFGVRDYSVDDLDKEKPTTDYTFHKLGIGEAKTTDRPNTLALPRLPGQKPKSGGPGAGQPNRNRAADELDKTDKGQAGLSLSILGQSNKGGEIGAHTAPELELRNLLETSSRPASQSVLQDFLKANAAQPLRKEQQERRDSFRQFLDAPAGQTAQTGMSDPINQRTDLTRERLFPNTALDTSAGRELSPAAPGPGLGRYNREMSSLPDANRWSVPTPGLPSGWPAQSDAMRAQRPQQSSMGGSMFREGPRRGGL